MGGGGQWSPEGAERGSSYLKKFELASVSFLGEN